MNRFWGHLSTINHHKILVTKLCFRCHLYYQGFRSPINREKEVKGYSLGWLHHKGRNRHHWEYWLDNGNVKNGVIAIEMPVNYVVEMICDRIAASMTYQKENYTDASALEYFLNGYDRVMMHPNTKALTQHILEYLRDHGLDQTIAYIRHNILKNK